VGSVSLIAIIVGDTTATRYVREPDVINVAKGNNTYQIVHTGNSDVAMDEGGVKVKT